MSDDHGRFASVPPESITGVIDLTQPPPGTVAGWGCTGCVLWLGVFVFLVALATLVVKVVWG